MTEQAASQASTEGKNCLKKKQEASPAFLQPERHLLIMPRGQYFRVDLSGVDLGFEEEGFGYTPAEGGSP